MAPQQASLGILATAYSILLPYASEHMRCDTIEHIVQERYVLPSLAHDIADPDQATMGFVVLLPCQKKKQPQPASVKVVAIPPKMAAPDISASH